MGLKFRKSFGPKGFKVNVGKRGITSTSLKIAPGVTVNSKRGLTVGIPGTGLSYNTGGKKRKTSFKNSTNNAAVNSADRNLKIEKQKEYNRKFKEFTGGYNRKATIAIIVSFIICVTPLAALGVLLLIPSLIWFIVDTLLKVIKFNRHLKNLNISE
jgi:hypothetical protein